MTNYSAPLPPAGWYPDPRGTGGRSYWNGHEWGSPPSRAMANRRGLVIGGSVVGLLVLLLLIGNLRSGDDNKSVATTVTQTVTVTAAPPQPFVAPPATVTVTAQAAPPAPAPLAPPPEATAEAPLPAAPVDTPPPSSAYYSNCSQARAAGAAPLYAGEPGYRSGLDRDGDGVACE
ncbi:excalibur calcium-binding domain-containing protein [Mycobacterium sp. NPDC048908]|uniref:excalibur calcium-binding domain-containing protein n=1 Tax=Mycobacterium sp. NPDC048908 TaxID=3364292 RepID=UPI0037142196